MKIREPGNAGLMVSIAGLGCSNFGGHVADDVARTMIDKAFKYGTVRLYWQQANGNILTTAFFWQTLLRIFVTFATHQGATWNRT